MDSFEVTAKRADILESSELVDELQHRSVTMKHFPILWNGYVHHFQELHGGYVKSGGYHLVKLSSDSMHSGSIPDLDEGNYEIHLDKRVYTLEVTDFYEFEDDDVYTLALQVTGYEEYPYSFAEDMRDVIDGRWTEYNYE